MKWIDIHRTRRRKDRPISWAWWPIRVVWRHYSHAWLTWHSWPEGSDIYPDATPKRCGWTIHLGRLKIQFGRISQIEIHGISPLNTSAKELDRMAAIESHRAMVERELCRALGIPPSMFGEPRFGIGQGPCVSEGRADERSKREPEGGGTEDRLDQPLPGQPPE